MGRQTSVEVNHWGCLSIIAFIVFLWALCFGVTINGKHHGMSCSQDEGVKFE